MKDLLNILGLIVMPIGLLIVALMLIFAQLRYPWECTKGLRGKLFYLKLDILEFLARIEMKIKYNLHKKYYDSLTEDDIPKDTFYCYSGCRIIGDRCPYLDYSKIFKSNYCHYDDNFDVLLNDECKMCGISEIGDGEE